MNVDDTTKSAPDQIIAPLVFTATIFLSASLLFFVQPLFAKIVLPLVGGAPAVWTTAMLFFQSVLIGGYLYAHLSTKYLPVIGQVLLHMALWAAALFFLPLSVQAGWQFDPDTPLAWQTLSLFAFGVGLPFAVLSANAPLIQSWYAKSDGPSADDPYFLYGASNLGALIALLAFPLAAEPLFGASQIGLGWAAGFVLLGLLLATSGFLARKGAATATLRSQAAGPSLSNYARWTLLAFVPSSLMLAVTTKISTDLGSFPLIWILPLSLFLLTFVLTFTQKVWVSDPVLNVLFLISLGLFALILSRLSAWSGSVRTTVLMLFGFFFIALRVHRWLYEARPDKKDLTVFYVVMSVGGALGGLFNAIAAPAWFVELDELPVTVLLAALVLLFGTKQLRSRDFAIAAVCLAVVILPLMLQNLFGTGATFGALKVLFSLLLLVTLYLLRHQSIACVAVIAGVLVVGKLLSTPNAIFQDRSFFGTHLINETDDLRTYLNGTTIHGAQLRSQLDRTVQPTPLYYYHPDAPMAQIINSDIGRAAQDIGIIGLGIGSLACYAQPDQTWQFYEIDAMVDQTARNPELFTFMSSCAGDAPTHIGDARVVLAAQADVRYDILMVDAYSSDAVPVHLMTNEAIALYVERLTAGGLVILHISNRYYDLAGPLGRSVADLGLSARIQDYPGDAAEPQNSSSLVVVMARNDADLATIDATDKWQKLQSDDGRLWTDDYANILSALK